jgi:opacity protein-like surface antigen
MKQKSRQKEMQALALVLAAGLSAPALAAEAGTAYVGAALGQSSVDYSSSQCTQDFGITCATDTTDTAVRIFVGYNIVPQVAVEAAYTDLGKATLDFPGVGASGDIKSDAFTLELLGRLPLQGSPLSFYGHIGIFSSDTTISAVGAGGSASDSQTSSDLTFGAGAEYALNSNITARLDVSRFDSVGKGGGGDGANVDVVALGLSYTFDK